MSGQRELTRRATRSRVLVEAGRLFEQRGFAATTIRDIAEASGVSVGTVMAAGDKPALLVQVFDGLIAAAHASRESRKAVELRGPQPELAERLVALVEPFLEIFTDRLELARVYASILVSGTHESTLFTTLAAALVDEIRTVLESSGSVIADHAATAEAVYFAYIGTLFSWSARPTADPARLGSRLRTTFAAICDGRG